MSATPKTIKYVRAYDFIDEPHAPHYGIVAVAIALSFLAHVIVFVTVPRLRISTMPSVKVDVPQREFKQLHVTMSDPLPAQAEEVDFSAEKVISSMASAGADDTGEITETLSPTFSEPPPMQAEPEVVRPGIASEKISDVLPPVNVDAPPPVFELMNSAIKDIDVAPRPIPEIDRSASSVDYRAPVELITSEASTLVLPEALPAAPKVSLAVGMMPSKPFMASGIDEAVTAVPYEKSLEQFAEAPSEVSSFTQVDDRLGLIVQTYSEGAQTYFKVTVAVADQSALPPIPKDIVFVQDASRSMAEERLHFCRDAISTCLAKLSPSDRFNVAAFSSDTRFCFNGWAPVNGANVEQAKTFVATMKSAGETDIFQSLQTVLQLPRDSKRPLIVIFITDGNATAGLTESSRIIGEFSKLNDNVSLFAIGTQKRANQYFLDLLSFCNRGSGRLVDSGRWDIPAQIEAVAASVARPVLGRISVTPTTASQADIFPRPAANLYASKALEFYGNCPAGVNDLVLRVSGEGGAAECDVIFQVDLGKTEKGSSSIKNEWARRKMHFLIGEYARNPSDKTKQDIVSLSSSASIPVPYRDKVWR